MIVEPYRPIHLEILRVQGAQPLQARTLSLVPAGSASLSRPPGPALTARIGEHIVAVGGILRVDPRHGTLWGVLAEDAGRYMIRLDRIVRRFVESNLYQRIEATTPEGFLAGIRWLQLMGFEQEGAMRAYDEEGNTHLRFARIREPIDVVQLQRPGEG